MNEEKMITFPKSEWDAIKSRLDGGKIIWTVRVDDEYGKYKTGDVLKTEWGQAVRIVLVKKISGGINELEDEYQFFDHLTKEMIDDLKDYNEMEIISLEILK